MSSLTSLLEKHLGRRPVLGKNVYIARTAVVIGDVELGEGSSVWYQAVLRGDINRIVVGHHTNIQDHATVHLAEDLGCAIGNYVTIGHTAIVHACTVGNETLVGMGSIILDRAVVGSQCIIGAGAVVPQRMEIPDGSLVLGTPAKVVRSLTAAERADLKSWAEKYVMNAQYCLQHGINVGGPR